MEVQVNFKVINPDYSQEYADEYNGGQESESNWKYNWAVSYGLKDVQSVSTIDNNPFIFKGSFENGDPFSFNIPNTHIFRCHFADGSHQDFAVSKSILNKTHQPKKEKYDVIRYYFYINADPASQHLSPNLVIDERYIPKKLQLSEC